MPKNLTGITVSSAFSFPPHGHPAPSPVVSLLNHPFLQSTKSVQLSKTLTQRVGGQKETVVAIVLLRNPFPDKSAREIASATS